MPLERINHTRETPAPYGQVSSFRNVDNSDIYIYIYIYEHNKQTYFLKE